MITLKEYSVMAMLSMCTASWTCWGGIFPPQRSVGCLFAVQFALLFSPSLLLSFPLLFSWDFLVLVLKHENILLCACPLRPFFCHLIFFSSSLPLIKTEPFLLFSLDQFFIRGLWILCRTLTTTAGHHFMLTCVEKGLEQTTKEVRK